MAMCGTATVGQYIRAIWLQALALPLLPLAALAQNRPSLVSFQIVARTTGIESTQILQGVSSHGGMLAVLRRTEPLFVQFAPSGQKVASFGRRGRGPGEFGEPGAIGWRGDSIWVWDGGRRQIIVFQRDGRFLRSVPLPNEGQGTMLDNGSVTVHPRQYLLPPGPISYSLQVRTLVDTGFGLGEPIFVVDFSYGILSYRRRGGTVARLQPFEDGPIFSPAPDGSGFILIERGGPRVTAMGAFLVKKIGASGQTLLSVMVRYHPRPISADLVRIVVDDILREDPSPAEQGLADRVRSALEVPEFLPPVTSLLVGDDGTIWIRRERTSEPATEWTVLDNTGHKLFSAKIDNSLRLLAANRTGFWAVQSVPGREDRLLRYRSLAEAGKQ